MKFLLALITLTSMAQASVCVRNYDSKNSVCKLFPQLYSYVKSQEGKTLCVREYVEPYCQHYANEYRHVQSTEGKQLCTVKYDQPQLVNLCAKYPEAYFYVDEAR